MLLIRDARPDDIPAIEEMVEDFVKGHPAENHPRSVDALHRAYFGERPVAIVAAICGQARRAGAEFLHGGGGEKASKLYERVAIGMASRECFLSGRSFQVMAGLEGLPVREIVRRLPAPELSRQPPESEGHA